MRIPPKAVICPYCGKPAELVDSSVIYNGRSYGLMWLCRPCDARVGCHRGSNGVPLGQLANAELRRWRERAHEVFDSTWKIKHGGRKEAYRSLQKLMGLTSGQAHIAMFSVEQCKKLIEIILDCKTREVPA